MELAYLSEYPQFVETLAKWHYQEWGEILQNWNLKTAKAELSSHTGKRVIPTTLIALEKGELLGSASLLAEDLHKWQHLSPWLASVYVSPLYRRKGIGKALVDRIIKEAYYLNIPQLYLCTFNQEPYYTKMGWKVYERAQYRELPIVIMSVIPGEQ